VHSAAMLVAAALLVRAGGASAASALQPEQQQQQQQQQRELELVHIPKTAGSTIEEGRADGVRAGAEGTKAAAAVLALQPKNLAGHDVQQPRNGTVMCSSASEPLLRGNTGVTTGGSKCTEWLRAAWRRSR